MDSDHLLTLSVVSCVLVLDNFENVPKIFSKKKKKAKLFKNQNQNAQPVSVL